MAKEPITTYVEREIAQQTQVAADELGINRSAYIAMAIKAELNRLDARKLVQQAVDAETKARRERDDANITLAENEKAIATALGQPEATMADCLRKIDVLLALSITIFNQLQKYVNWGFWKRLFGIPPEPEPQSEDLQERYAYLVKVAGNRGIVKNDFLRAVRDVSAEEPNQTDETQ